METEPKTTLFLIEWNMDRYSVTGIDYCRNCDRAYNGWPIGNRPTTNYNGAGIPFTFTSKPVTSVIVY